MRDKYEQMRWDTMLGKCEMNEAGAQATRSRGGHDVQNPLVSAIGK